MKLNRIYYIEFNDGDYESGDTTYTIIAKNKIRALKLVRECYGDLEYAEFSIEIIGYTVIKEGVQ
jgi:hypothetical protein